MKKILTPLLPLCKFLAAALLVTFSFRFLFSLQHVDRISDASQFGQILISGMRVDLAFLAQVILLPLLILIPAIWVPRLQFLAFRLVNLWLAAWILLIVFLEVATPLFISQFDVRPNRLFIEYLDSPLEISGTLSRGFPLESLAVILVTALLGALAIWAIRTRPAALRMGFLAKLLATVILCTTLVLDVFIGRSGLQHRPLNPAMVSLSNDRLVNSLVLNSTYSVLYAAYSYRHEADSEISYAKIPHEQMIANVKSHMDKNLVFVDGKLETLHVTDSVMSPSTPRKDLIVVVEESLGASFVESLGGQPVTPNIEKWRHKSWFFDNLYATGIRSARGLEAVITGFPPSPSRAVLKLPRAQSEFFTLAAYLKKAGYESTFVYGGESHFDNMRGFFLSNGFDRVIDQYDYDNPEFMGSWGVSDEDLFERALAEIGRDREKPGFFLVFSSSNHPPYEFPDNRIELFDSANKATAMNAAKYADYALGKFLDALDRRDILSRTTVLVVSDHEDKVFGSDPVPVDRYRIPAFILDPDRPEPVIDKNLASQIDLPETLVSLLGINLPRPTIGHDLARHVNQHDGRAIMQFGENQAYMTEDCTVFLQPHREPITRCIGKHDASVDADLENTALAHAIFPRYAYEAEAYGL